MSLPRGLQGSQLTFQTSVGSLPAAVLQCSKQETKPNNQQNQSRIASSPKNTSTGYEDIKCPFKEACKAANWHRTPAPEAFQNQSYYVHTHTHRYQLAMQTLNVAPRRLARQTSRKPVSSSSPTMLQVRNKTQQPTKSIHCSSSTTHCPEDKLLYIQPRTNTADEASTHVAVRTIIQTLSNILHPDFAAMASSHVRDRFVSDTITILESTAST